MTDTNKPNHQQLGYSFSPKPHSQSAGHPGLEINISKDPTEMHFDPKTVKLPVFPAIANPKESIEHLTINHPWTHQSMYQITPGILIITDRKGIKLEAFTFGGKIQIITDDDLDTTKCLIESKAPIFEIERKRTTEMRFIEEVEILLAKRHAVSKEHDDIFEMKLAKIPPIVLYAACIEELIQHFSDSHSKEYDEICDLLDWLRAEKRLRIKDGLWPENLSLITEIL